MKLERPNCFSDEDLQMELLYGPEWEFHKTSLNFWTDIYPNVLESYVSNHQPDKGYKDIFVDTSYYPLGIDQILRLAVRTFKDTTIRRQQMNYSSAYRTGWFNPEQAAIYLSKSKSWLAKKRMSDRKKALKTSIPFVGHLKGILYPKKALEAYRIQDWNTLQQQCKKYGIGAQEKPEEKKPEVGSIRWIKLRQDEEDAKHK